MSRRDDSRREQDDLERSLTSPIADVPCRPDTSAFCVPFPASDPVRLFYQSQGMAFEERCMCCRRLIVEAAVARKSEAA